MTAKKLPNKTADQARLVEKLESWSDAHSTSLILAKYVMILTANIDVSVLERAIPDIVAFGRRTMIEQCVTSAAIICVDAQKRTAAVAIGVIDAELAVDVTPVLVKRGKRKGLPLKSGKTNVAVPQRGLAAMIVVARMHPGSDYSLSTGNRWPVAKPQTKGTAAFWQAIQVIAQRMVKARHSSTHFLQHGWAEPIRRLLSDPNYYAGRSKFQSRQQSRVNPLNTLNQDRLGTATVDLAGNECLVLAENAVGEGGNDVLDRKHRIALIREGTIPLQEAVDAESRAIAAQSQKYFDQGLKQNFGYL